MAKFVNVSDNITLPVGNSVSYLDVYARISSVSFASSGIGSIAIQTSGGLTENLFNTFNLYETQYPRKYVSNDNLVLSGTTATNVLTKIDVLNTLKFVSSGLTATNELILRIE